MPLQLLGATRIHLLDISLVSREWQALVSTHIGLQDHRDTKKSASHISPAAQASCSYTCLASFDDILLTTASTEEKLKTVSEELEEFVDTSVAADVERLTGKGRPSNDADSKDNDGFHGLPMELHRMGGIP